MLNARMKSIEIMVWVGEQRSKGLEKTMYRSAGRALVITDSSSQQRQTTAARGERNSEMTRRLDRASLETARGDCEGRGTHAGHLQQAQRQESLGHGACPALETQSISSTHKTMRNSTTVFVAASMRSVIARQGLEFGTGEAD